MNTIFELQEIEIFGIQRPIRKTILNRIGLFSEKEMAEKEMHEVIRRRESDYRQSVLGYILTEITIDSPERMVSCCSYTHDGKYNDRNLVERSGTYNGRPKEMIRFHRGDIVEAYNLGCAELMVVYGEPASPEFYENIRECNEPLGRWDKSMYDHSDDQYTLLPLYGDSHSHVESQYVFAPTKPVPKKWKAEFAKQLLKE